MNKNLRIKLSFFENKKKDKNKEQNWMKKGIEKDC